jgi:hypothetical protein
MSKLMAVCAVAVAGSILFTLAEPRPAFATTRYIAQKAGAFSGGTACNGQTAITPATFNGITNSPGDVNYICGAITAATGPVFSPQGSGNSTSPVTFIFDTGARISVSFGEVINLGGLAYALFDGGIPCGPSSPCDTVEASNPTSYATGQAGIIEATANGSSLQYQNPNTQAFYGCVNCHDIEIRNLIIRNLYVHSSTSDQTDSADTGTFAFQCPFSNGCAAGTISIHDSSIHDVGNAVSIEGTTATSIKIYNVDFSHDNWAVENSGNGTRYLYIYGNYFHDTTNWDTSSDSFHHNGVHNYMNVSTDSLGYYFYNNMSFGDWGPCCSTAIMLFTEVAHPANFYVFNNIAIQSCNNNTAPVNQDYTAPSGPGESWYNNTFLGCPTTGSNTWALQFYGLNMSDENNAVQGWGQYVTVGSGYSFKAIDYNVYGSPGSSGNSPYQCGNSGVSAFAPWQATGCSPDAHGQSVSDIQVNSSTAFPSSTSPLRATGINLTSICNGQPNPGLGALCYDYAGKARPTTGNWDVGAVSYSTSKSPNPPIGLTGTVVSH